MPLEDRLDEGFSIKLDFADFPDVEFWEIDVGLPGYIGGGPILTSTQRNETVHTKSPKSLIDIPDTQTKVAFSSTAFDATTVRAMINSPTLMTYTLPDLSTYAVYGYMDEFIPDPFVIGERPTANCKFVHTNTHPTTKEEVLPEFTAAP